MSVAQLHVLQVRVMVARPERLFTFLNEHWETKATVEILADPTVQTFEQMIEKLEEQKKAIDRFLRTLPPQQLLTVAQRAMSEEDPKRPFNAFGTEADFEHFGRCPCLSVPEAAALAMGKDPRIVTEKMLGPYYGISIFADRFANLLDLLDRAVAFGELANLFTPHQFLTWAHEHKIELPEEFIRYALIRGEPIRYWHDLCSDLAHDLDAVNAELDTTRAALEVERESQLQRTFDEWVASSGKLEQLTGEHQVEVSALKESLTQAQAQIATLLIQLASKPSEPSDTENISTTERKSLLTIIAAMAAKGYVFDPNDGRSAAPGEIANDAHLVGLRLSDDTVRKYLKEACKLNGFVVSNTRRQKPKSVRRKPKSV